MLYLDKSCHSVVRIALRSLLLVLLHLSKGENVRLGELLRLAMLEVLGHEVCACRHDIRIGHLSIHLLRALLAHGACLRVRQRKVLIIAHREPSFLRFLLMYLLCVVFHFLTSRNAINFVVP